MENPSAWFRAQLTTSAEAFVWAVEQMPEERLFLVPPRREETWPAARHVFHLLSYERRLALPSMHIWLGETFERDETYEEDVAWENAEWAKGHDLQAMVEDFRQIRAEQTALLAAYDDESWNKTLPTPAWDDVTLNWVLTKTLQHTFEHTNDVLAIVLFWDSWTKKANDE